MRPRGTTLGPLWFKKRGEAPSGRVRPRSRIASQAIERERMAFAQHAVDRLGGLRAPALRLADAQRRGRKRSASIGVAGLPAGPPARQPPRLARQVGERRLERGEAKPQARGPDGLRGLG